MSSIFIFKSRTSSIAGGSIERKAAEEMLDYKGCGMSVMEMSHRSKNVPADY